MTDAKRLARAVLLFHRGGRWTETDRNEWVMLTGEEEATTKTLCDLARRIAFEAPGHTRWAMPTKSDHTPDQGVNWTGKRFDQAP